PDHVILLLQLPNGNAQQGLVRKLSIGDDEELDAWVEIGTVVCEEHELDPREALVRNGRFAMGALALDPDTHLLWYRHTFQLKFVKPPSDQFAGALAMLIKVGDLVEHE